MMKAIGARLAMVCGLCCGAAAMCAAQTYTPPPPPLTTLPPCPVEKDAKKRAKRKDCDPTVYPQETVETKGKKGSDAAAASTQTDQPAPTSSAARAHPYPGDSSADMPSDAAVPKRADAASAGAAHPYPGDNGKDVPYNPADDPEEKGKPVPPHDPAAEQKAADTAAGKANPFPSGASPDMPTDGAEPSSQGDKAPSSSTPPESSSSSSSSSSPSSEDAAAGAGGSSRGTSAKNPDDDDEEQPKLTDKGSEGKRSKKVVKPQTDTDRVDEDLSVAKFYGQSGNYMGAYLRAKDAVKTQPEYPEAHLALAEAARRLKKTDEAIAEFGAYLKLEPDGKDARAAEKALEELK